MHAMYFDVLDILVVELSPSARIEIRSQSSAWGASDQRDVYIDELKFAAISLATLTHRDCAERADRRHVKTGQCLIAGRKRTPHPRTTRLGGATSP